MKFARRVVLLAGAMALLLAGGLFLAGKTFLAAGSILGAIWGILYFLQLARGVHGFPIEKFGTIRRLLFVTAGFILFLKLGISVFWGALLGFFLYKPALALLVLLGSKE